MTLAAGRRLFSASLPASVAGNVCPDSARSAAPGYRGPSLALRDVFAHRDASINEIAERTGLPQSYVSESVAKLREQALVQTMIDPADKRRTLVRISDAHPRSVADKGAVDVDAALADALGYGDVDTARQVIDLLTMLCERLRPARPGPILDQLRQARHDMEQ